MLFLVSGFMDNDQGITTYFRTVNTEVQHCQKYLWAVEPKLLIKEVDETTTEKDNDDYNDLEAQEGKNCIEKLRQTNANKHK